MSSCSKDTVGAYTPGPWHEHSVELYIVCGANGQAVADTEADSIDQDERFANARLIAAAPDLLEALIDTLDFLERHSNRWDGVNGKHPQVVVTAARAAIAKATGAA